MGVRVTPVSNPCTLPPLPYPGSHHRSRLRDRCGLALHFHHTVGVRVCVGGATAALHCVCHRVAAQRHDTGGGALAAAARRDAHTRRGRNTRPCPRESPVRWPGRLVDVRGKGAACPCEGGAGPLRRANSRSVAIESLTGASRCHITQETPQACPSGFVSAQLRGFQRRLPVRARFALRTRGGVAGSSLQCARRGAAPAGGGGEHAVGTFCRRHICTHLHARAYASIVNVHHVGPVSPCARCRLAQRACHVQRPAPKASRAPACRPLGMLGAWAWEGGPGGCGFLGDVMTQGGGGGGRVGSRMCNGAPFSACRAPRGWERCTGAPHSPMYAAGARAPVPAACKPPTASSCLTSCPRAISHDVHAPAVP
jgi:hypothetical protein